MTEKHWRDIIILIIAFVFTGLLSSIILNMLLPSTVVGISNSSYYVLSVVITQFIMFGGTVFLFLKSTGRAFKGYIKFGKPNKTHLLYVLICFGLAIIFTIAFSPISELIQTRFPNHVWVIHQLEVTSTQNDVLGQLRGYKLPMALFVFALVPALCEELVFRGILYRILKNISGKKSLAILLSAIIFSLVHFQVLSFIPITIVGILLAYLYEKTDNLINPILLHFAFNAVQIILWQA